MEDSFRDDDGSSIQNSVENPLDPNIKRFSKKRKFVVIKKGEREFFKSMSQEFQTDVLSTGNLNELIKTLKKQVDLKKENIKKTAIDIIFKKFPSHVTELQKLLDEMEEKFITNYKSEYKEYVKDSLYELVEKAQENIPKFRTKDEFEIWKKGVACDEIQSDLLGTSTYSIIFSNDDF